MIKTKINRKIFQTNEETWITQEIVLENLLNGGKNQDTALYYNVH